MSSIGPKAGPYRRRVDLSAYELVLNAEPNAWLKRGSVTIPRVGSGMEEIDLTRVDINLLVVFDALMRERHVGRAANQLFLSQSATSHALSRLRKLLGDTLFTRHPRGVEPTLRARALAGPIGDVLSGVRAIVRPEKPFDPKHLRRTFRVAAHDLTVLMILAPLLSKLNTIAPGVDVRALAINHDTVVDDLDRGKLDFALGAFGDMPQRILKTPSFRDDFIGVARNGHPRLEKERMSLEAFVDLPHALVSWSGDAHGQVDRALAALGLRRRVALTVTSFLALPFVVGSSDIISVLSRLAAVQMAQSAGLTLFPLPIEINPFTSYIVALRQLAFQPDIAWFGNVLLAAGAGKLAD